MTTGHLAQLLLPQDWQWLRFDHVAQRKHGCGSEALQPLSVFLNGGVVPRSDRAEENHNRLGEDLGKYLMVIPGDIVFNKLRTWQGGFGASRFVGIVSPAYFVLRPRAGVSARFLDFLLHSKTHLAELKRRSKWMPPSQFDIPWDQLKTLPILCPPEATQVAIANFLDRKTAAIDALISKKERLIEVLQEKRQALITQAVTKGLDPNVPMKDSGLVGRLGRVPAHWGVVRNKVIFAERSVRAGPSATHELLTVSHITGVTRRSEKPDVGMFMAESFEDYKVVEKNDLAINTMWAWMGALGIVPYAGIVSPSYNVYRFRTSAEVHCPYYDLLYRTPDYVVEINRYSKGIWASRLRLYPEEFLAMQTLVPPLEEQVRIVEHINDESGKDVELIAKLKLSIEVAQEYRQALITAAVTGKLNVESGKTT
jgi:type I restriction enzyme S subunit